MARFPHRVPPAWLEGSRRGHKLVSALVAALADEGDPERALQVLHRLTEDVTAIMHSGDFYRLGRIADSAMVQWAGRWSGSGGPAEVRALASFARCATVDEVLWLLERLMRRVEGHVLEKEAIVGSEVNDPWSRAFADILKATRLRDVPGAGAWLAKMLMKTKSSILRAWIIEAMAEFPSTWSLIETEALKVVDYVPSFQPDCGRADEMAQVLFLAARPVEEATVAGTAS